MAWALLAAGRPAEAVPYAKQAIASRPAVASVHFHAAAVFAAVGSIAAARAEMTAAARNPWFSSSQADRARKLAAQLQVTWPSATASTTTS